jgi:ABC-type lipoprotein export system ATPase subunit
MANDFVTVKNLCKSYKLPAGNVEVLRGIDLQVGQGASIAIVGPSGSGKSTLLNLLAGLLKADSGEIQIGSQSFAQLTEEEIEKFRARHTGIVFQQHHLLMQCTALENILLPTLPIKVDSRVARQKALALLERVGMQNRADHFPAQLSGGEQHRIALARALINEPELILADEPTGSLDPEKGREILDLLSKDRNYTLITVTHADYVAAAMDRRYILKEGKLKPQK